MKLSSKRRTSAKFLFTLIVLLTAGAFTLPITSDIAPGEAITELEASWSNYAYNESHEKRFIVFRINNEDQTKGKGLRGYATVMERQQDGTIKVIRKYPTAYGAKGAGKVKSGDLRTPLGVYTILNTEQRRRKHRREFQKFGGWSLPLNYPNAFDQAQGRTGYAIKIHGGRNGNTLGCPRILDGTIDRPKMGHKNIADFAKLCGKDTKVVIMENIPETLLADQDETLSPEAVRFWNNTLREDISYEALLSKVTTFTNRLNRILLANA